MTRTRIPLWLALFVAVACGILPFRVCVAGDGSGRTAVELSGHAHDAPHDPLHGGGGGEDETCCEDRALDVGVPSWSWAASALDVPALLGTSADAPPAAVEAPRCPAPGAVRVPRQSDPVVLLR